MEDLKLYAYLTYRGKIVKTYICMKYIGKNT